MSDHIGTGGNPGKAEVPRRCGVTEHIRRQRTAHPAVALPLRLAVAQTDPMDHGVTEKPVIQIGIDLTDWVGAVTQIPPI
jgi:hypothetical protein